MFPSFFDIVKTSLQMAKKEKVSKLIYLCAIIFANWITIPRIEWFDWLLKWVIAGERSRYGVWCTGSLYIKLLQNYTLHTNDSNAGIQAWTHRKAN